VGGEHGGGEVRGGGSGCRVAAGVLPLRSQAAWREWRWQGGRRRV
jgi:hypothetical protein